MLPHCISCAVCFLTKVTRDKETLYMSTLYVLNVMADHIKKAPWTAVADVVSQQRNQVPYHT